MISYNQSFVTKKCCVTDIGWPRTSDGHSDPCTKGTPTTIDKKR